MPGLVAVGESVEGLAGDRLGVKGRAEVGRDRDLARRRVELEIDVEKSTLTNKTTGDQWTLSPLGEVMPILEAGGVFPYAKKVGMLKQ